MKILENQEEHKITENGYIYYKIEDVINYEFDRYNSWTVNIKNIDIKNAVNYYLIIDTVGNEAFAHWVYESSIYIPLYHHLKKQYPDIKIVLKTKKDYKSLFLTYFNVNINDIVYNIDTNISNICFFPNPDSSMNYQKISDNWKKYVDILFESFNECQNKIFDTSLLPRGKKENFMNIDRFHNLKDIEDSLKKSQLSYNIMYTDNIIDLKDQIIGIQNSKKIIVTDGSAFLVNGMFCTPGTKIIVLGIVTPKQMNYPKNKYIFDKIVKKCSVIYIGEGPTFLFKDIERLL